MSRWYENKKSNLFGEQCDDALDNQDCETLLKLVEKAWQLGHNTDEQTILRAKYLYDGFTCLSNWISISSHLQHNSNKSYVHYEREHEKCLYLCVKQ